MGSSTWLQCLSDPEHRTARQGGSLLTLAEQIRPRLRGWLRALRAGQFLDCSTLNFRAGSSVSFNNCILSQNQEETISEVSGFL